MKFAQGLDLAAGSHALLLPHYFLEGKKGDNFSPAITHPNMVLREWL